jgi:hypothetical protein
MAASSLPAALEAKLVFEIAPSHIEAGAWVDWVRTSTGVRLLGQGLEASACLRGEP